jgi:hypothetical protein
MKNYRPLTCSSDRRAEMPANAEERRARIECALASLDHETRRVEQLGLEDPQVRCEQERRYWAFLAAVHAVTNPQSPVLSRQLACWLAGNFEPVAKVPNHSRIV